MRLQIEEHLLDLVELLLVLRVVGVAEHRRDRADDLRRRVDHRRLAVLLRERDELSPGRRPLLDLVRAVHEARRAPVLHDRVRALRVVGRPAELRVDVLRDVLELRPVEREQPLLGDELLRHVARRTHEVVAARPAPQLRRERLVRVVEALLDLDAGRLRERRVRLRVHVLRPVVVEERPLGLGRRERVGSAEATETRRRERRRSGAGNEAASVDGSLPDRELVAHSFPPSSKSRASPSAHETATRSPSASASMPPLSPDRCCRANTS